MLMLNINLNRVAYRMRESIGELAGSQQKMSNDFDVNTDLSNPARAVVFCDTEKFLSIGEASQWRKDQVEGMKNIQEYHQFLSPYVEGKIQQGASNAPRHRA